MFTAGRGRGSSHFATVPVRFWFQAGIGPHFWVAAECFQWQFQITWSNHHPVTR